MILSAVGIVDCAPLELSEILKGLRISHTFAWHAGPRYGQLDIDGQCEVQPAWPVIIDKVKTISKVWQPSRDRLIYFVLDARAALGTCNISQALWPENRNGGSLEEYIKKALTFSNSLTKEWALERKEPSTLEYVNIATKPSFLNHVQSAIYKITPYDLRKSIQTMCISYLAGFTPYSTMKHELKKSLKLEDLLRLMDSDKAKELRIAVGLLSNDTVESVAKKTGYETFELLYVQRSFVKAQL